MRSKRDIHRHHWYRRVNPKKQPIYDFAIIKVDIPMWHGRQSFDNEIIPVCLPKTWMWRYRFFGQNAQISGYGRDEPFPVEGEFFLN